MYQPQFSVQQSQFESPPVLYSQSQPMMISNQNNMSYQMVNLGAGAIMQRLKQRQEEEVLVDLLAKQNQLIAQLTEDFNWRMDKRKQQMEEELEQLEKRTIIARQKKAEQDYLYKLNRQLNFGIQRIKEQELKKMIYPKPISLGMKVPSIQNHEALEQVYPNSRFLTKEKIDEEIQANFDLDQRGLMNSQYQQQQQQQMMMPMMLSQQPQMYQPQFNQQQSYQQMPYLNNTNNNNNNNNTNNNNNQYTSPKRLSQVSKQQSQQSQRSNQLSEASQHSKKSQGN